MARRRVSPRRSLHHHDRQRSDHLPIAYTYPQQRERPHHRRYLLCRAGLDVGRGSVSVALCTSLSAHLCRRSRLYCVFRV